MSKLFSRLAVLASAAALSVPASASAYVATPFACEQGTKTSVDRIGLKAGVVKTSVGRFESGTVSFNLRPAAGQVEDNVDTAAVRVVDVLTGRVVATGDYGAYECNRFQVPLAGLTEGGSKAVAGRLYGVRVYLPGKSTSLVDTYFKGWAGVFLSR